MAKKNIIEEFIASYKLLEQHLRSLHGLDYTVFDYEKTLSPEEQEKLSLCRKLRNYIQHNTNASEFVSITPSMQLFIERHVNKVASLRLTAGSIAKKAKPLTLLDGIREVCIWMRKYDTDCVPIVDSNKTLCGYVTSTMVKDAIANLKNGEKIIIGKHLLVGGFPVPKLRTAEPLTVYENAVIDNPDVIAHLDARETVFVVNDTKTRYIGIISKKAGNWK